MSPVVLVERVIPAAAVEGLGAALVEVPVVVAVGVCRVQRSCIMHTP
jgi:hypothetical protein